MIVVILGLPGAGKSYLAEKVAKEYDALYLNSDKIKKGNPPVIDYQDLAKNQGYEEMFLFLNEALAEEKNVVLDATFYKKALRNKILKLADQKGVSVYFIEVVASTRVTHERIMKQRKYSDEDLKIYQKVKEQFDPLEVHHLSLRSDRLSITEMLRQVKEFIPAKEGITEAPNKKLTKLKK
jgi:predicted kinase